MGQKTCIVQSLYQAKLSIHLKWSQSKFSMKWRLLTLSKHLSKYCSTKCPWSWTKNLKRGTGWNQQFVLKRIAGMQEWFSRSCTCPLSGPNCNHFDITCNGADCTCSLRCQAEGETNRDLFQHWAALLGLSSGSAVYSGHFQLVQVEFWI